MGANLSIATTANHRSSIFANRSKPIPLKQLMGIAYGCGRLLEELGGLKEHVEIIVVRATYRLEHEPNIYSIKVVLNIGAPKKVEATYELDLSKWPRDLERRWYDLGEAIAGKTSLVVKQAMRDHFEEVTRLYARLGEITGPPPHLD